MQSLFAAYNNYCGNAIIKKFEFSYLCLQRKAKGERNAEACNYQLYSQPKIAFIFLIISLGFAKSSLNQTPTDATAMVDHYPAFFNCSTSKSPVEKFGLWKFYALGVGEEERKYIYDGGRIIAEYKDIFDVEIDSSSGAFNLVVLLPLIRYAGRYECSDDYDHPGASAELVVLESNWDCESNMDPDGVVGPTECNETITPDNLYLSCSVICIGKHFPEIELRIYGKSFTPLRPQCVKNGTRLTCDATLKVSPQIEGSISICQKGTEHCSHALKVNKVLYAFVNVTKTEYGIGEEVMCIANVSKQLPCSYRWYTDNTMEVSSHETFKPNKPGVYRCQAQCLIRGDNCTLLAMTISVPDTDTNVLPFLLILSVLVNIGFIGVLIWLWYVRRKTMQRLDKETQTLPRMHSRRSSNRNSTTSINQQNGSAAKHSGGSSGQKSFSSDEEQNGGFSTLPGQKSVSSDEEQNGGFSALSAAQSRKASVHSFLSVPPGGRGTPRRRGKHGVGKSTQQR